MNTASGTISEIILVSAGALTVAMVRKISDTAAWLYVAALLIGYAVTRPQNYHRVIDFFNSVTKGIPS